MKQEEKEILIEDFIFNCNYTKKQAEKAAEEVENYERIHKTI